MQLRMQGAYSPENKKVMKKKFQYQKLMLNNHNDQLNLLKDYVNDIMGKKTGKDELKIQREAKINKESTFEEEYRKALKKQQKEKNKES